MGVTFLMLARLPKGGLDAFDTYEQAVLPLLAEHGGHLERRLRTLDDRVEAHVISFPSEKDFAGYQADARRGQATPLLQSSGALVELLPVRDVKEGG